MDDGLPISIRLSTFPYGSGWGLGVQAGRHPHTKEEVAPGYQPCPCAIGLVQREDTYRRAGGGYPGLLRILTTSPVPSTCAHSVARHHRARRLYVAPREKGRPYQREGYRVLSARLSPIQRRAHPGLVIVKRFPCLASLPQELRAATPPGRAVSAWCLSWLVV